MNEFVCEWISGESNLERMDVLLGERDRLQQYRHCFLYEHSSLSQITSKSLSQVFWIEFLANPFLILQLEWNAFSQSSLLTNLIKFQVVFLFFCWIKPSSCNTFGKLVTATIFLMLHSAAA